MGPNIDDRLVREMLAKMGRNLLTFQQIESGLKFMLPVTHPGGSASGDDAYAVLKDEVRRQTLGGLRTRLLEAVKSDNPESFSAYVAAVVESRNGFIHHFHEQPGVSLTSEEGLRAAIAYLDQQDEFTEPLFRLVVDINKEIVAQLVDRDSVGELWRNVASEGEPKSMKNKD
jgi:hypothetical protein